MNKKIEVVLPFHNLCKYSLCHVEGPDDSDIFCVSLVEVRSPRAIQWDASFSSTTVNSCTYSLWLDTEKKNARHSLHDQRDRPPAVTTQFFLVTVWATESREEWRNPRAGTLDRVYMLLSLGKSLTPPGLLMTARKRTATHTATPRIIEYRLRTC